MPDCRNRAAKVSRKPLPNTAKKLRDVNMVNRRAIDDARGRAHDPANPNQVIAGLMLGFWAHMTDRIPFFPSVDILIE